MGKPIHFPTFSLPFALEEKEKATQKDGGKIERARAARRARCRKTRPAWCASALAERKPCSGLGGPSPGRARQAQGRERNATSAPLRPRGIQHTQRTPCHRHHGRLVQHDGGASPTRELGSRLPGKSTARGRAASELKADAAPQTSVLRQDGRIPQGALGDPQCQCRILR